MQFTEFRTYLMSPLSNDKTRRNCSLELVFESSLSPSIHTVWWEP